MTTLFSKKRAGTVPALQSLHPAGSSRGDLWNLKKSSIEVIASVTLQNGSADLAEQSSMTS
jgi:hypothetical protein